MGTFEEESMQSTESSSPRGAGAIIASTIAIVLILGIFAIASMPSNSKIELQDVLGDLVVSTEARHGLQTLHLEKLKDGRLVALFGDPDDLPPAGEMGEEFGMGGRYGGRRGRGMRGMGGGFGEPKPDPNSPWLKLPVGEAEQAPWQAALVHYPAQSKAESTLAREFGRLNFKDLSTIPKEGGSTVMDSGHLVWNGFRLPFVRTRHFRMEEKEPIFHDSMRINLTRKRHSLVLYLRWRPGQLGDVEMARPLLASWALPQG